MEANPPPSIKQIWSAERAALHPIPIAAPRERGDGLLVPDAEDIGEAFAAVGIDRGVRARPGDRDVGGAGIDDAGPDDSR